MWSNAFSIRRSTPNAGRSTGWTLCASRKATVSNTIRTAPRRGATATTLSVRFAEDKPYDQFLREQLAGDEIDSQNQEMLVAAGFNRLGPLRKNAGNQDAAYNRNEILVEMTNVIGSGLLGVTLGCARCHDHKFDPIRQKDYYRIQAFFADTQQKDIPFSTAEQQAEWKKKNSAIDSAIRRMKAKLKTASEPERVDLEKQIAEKEKELPLPLPALQTVEDNPSQFIPVHILARGNSGSPGEKVGMRPMGVLLPDGAPEWARPDSHAAAGTGAVDHRPRESADRARDGESNLAAPLRSRHRFDANDFGRMGSRPSHPELLDWLANQFVESGFRMKPLHRLILLSSTYQQDYLPVPPPRR